MTGRRVRRGDENRRSFGGRNVPTILSRKRKSDEDDIAQPVRFSYLTCEKVHAKCSYSYCFYYNLRN